MGRKILDLDFKCSKCWTPVLRNEEPDDHPGTGTPDEHAPAIPDGTEREDLEGP